MSDGYFNENLWEENYISVIEKKKDIQDLNPGQLAIIEEDFYNASVAFCRERGQYYTASGYTTDLYFDLGESKYNAISEIIEDTSIELEEAWDYSFAGDNTGIKAYGSVPILRWSSGWFFTGKNWILPASSTPWLKPSPPERSPKWTGRRR